MHDRPCPHFAIMPRKIGEIIAQTNGQPHFSLEVCFADPAWRSLTRAAVLSARHRARAGEPVGPHRTHEPPVAILGRRDVADEVQKRTGIPACLHLTCTNMERSKLDETLEVSLSIFGRSRVDSRARKRKHLGYGTYWPYEATHHAAKSTGLPQTSAFSMRSISSSTSEWSTATFSASA
jgi:hypothetical protein